MTVAVHLSSLPTFAQGCPVFKDCDCLSIQYKKGSCLKSFLNVFHVFVLVLFSFFF